MRERQKLTGQVWALVEQGRVRTGASGWANAATRVPMTPQTRVQVGSVAKTVLALAVLKAASDGLIDLDAPMAQLVPDVPIANPWAATSPLRLRHLLDMTGGLEDLRLWHMASTRTTHDMPLAAALAGLEPPLVLRSAPGTQFSYSNISITLAALALERRVGVRYEDWAQRALLQPLGMHGSSFHAQPPADAAAQGRQPVAWGHLEDHRPMVPPAIAVRPAAQFVTTAGDMGRLALFLLGGTLPDGSRPIRADLLAGMGLATGTDAWRAGLRTGYGLGLSTRDRDGAVGRCHGGSIAGFRAMFCLFDQSQKAFFIAHNVDDEDARYGQFDQALVRALGVASDALPAVAAAPDDARWAGVYVPAPSQMPQLALLDWLTGFRVLRIAGSESSVRQGFAAKQRLEAVGPRLYRQEGRVGATWALLGPAEGPHTLTNGFQTLRRVPALLLVATMVLVMCGTLVLLAWFAVPLWRHARGGPPCWRQPAWWGMVALVGSAALLATKDWRSLGDFDAAAIAVYAATSVLPVAAVAQLALRWRTAAAGERAAGIVGLAFLALLLAFGLLPLPLWRL